MNICFECGGKLKSIAKLGRTTWDGSDFYEIPLELKISTCLECGQHFEDSFVKAKIANAVRGQKKVKPNPRLLHLRWIDTFIDEMLKRPGMYGDTSAVYCQTLLLLEFRELFLSKGEDAKSEKIQDSLHKFLQQRWPSLGSFAFPKNVSLQDEFAPVLKEFCSVWINTA